jgi:geranylgeranyl diphosphate synthase type I
MYCGRAFQIKDDILGIFGDEKKTGKPTLTDLQEAKKTILIWHAYNNSKIAQRNTIKKIFAKQKVNWQDLLQIKRIIIESGSLQYACNEIDSLLKEIKRLNLSSHMRQPYKTALYNYFQELLRPPAVI